MTTRGHGESARQKAARLQEEAAAAERRRRTLIAALAVLVTSALVIGVTLFVRSQRHDDAPVAAPPFGSAGVIQLPAPAGSKPLSTKAVTVRTYLDYLCPICNHFEQATDAWQEQQVKAGLMKRELVPVGFLDHASAGSEFPTRAAGAAYCVATADRTKVMDFTRAMYADQPPENTPGMSDDEILAIAKKVIPNNSTMDSCIKNKSYRSYVRGVTDEANKTGVPGTPSVMINGKLVQLRPAEFLADLQQAVAAAR